MLQGGARVSGDGGKATTAYVAGDDDVVARGGWVGGCDAMVPTRMKMQMRPSHQAGRERGGVGRRKTIGRAIWSIHYPFSP